MADLSSNIRNKLSANLQEAGWIEVDFIMMAEFQGYITVEAVVVVVTSLQEVKFKG